jgi:hypothetical protein
MYNRDGEEWLSFIDEQESTIHSRGFSERYRDKK